MDDELFNTAQIIALAAAVKALIETHPDRFALKQALNREITEHQIELAKLPVSGEARLAATQLMQSFLNAAA